MLVEAGTRLYEPPEAGKERREEHRGSPLGPIVAHRSRRLPFSHLPHVCQLRPHRRKADGYAEAIRA
jgi:hypothetical protein